MLFKSFKTRDIVLCGIFLSFLVVASYIRIPIFGIPFTLQVFAVMLIGQILGAKRGFFTVLTYILCGTLGIPVFTGGGGLSYVLTPTYGYISGFAVAVLITGHFSKKSLRRVKIFGNFLALIPIYVFGLVHYFLISNLYLKNEVGIKYILVFGFIIFLPLDILYSVLSVFLAERIKKFIKM